MSISLKSDMELVEFGKTQLMIPKMITGTSSLGNLYETRTDFQKQEIVSAALQSSGTCTLFDTAGKYGAGLSLESLGRSLAALQVPKGQILVSNKLGWKRTTLSNGNPTFERDIWKGLSHDAAQRISYSGMMECFEEGLELLDGYDSQLVSVHDPDEYLFQSKSPEDYDLRFEQVLDAYRALFDLKAQGKVRAVGVGAKDWKTIHKIYRQVPLDWVMIANSMTLYSHPKELLDFMEELEAAEVGVINSAVFQSGFLIGGAYFDYERLDPQSPIHREKFEWRERFFKVCRDAEVSPAHACIQFGLNLPGVSAVALNSSSPAKVVQNSGYCQTPLPREFWIRLNEEGMMGEQVLQLILKGTK